MGEKSVGNTKEIGNADRMPGTNVCRVFLFWAKKKPRNNHVAGQSKTKKLDHYFVIICRDFNHNSLWLDVGILDFIVQRFDRRLRANGWSMSNHNRRFLDGVIEVGNRLRCWLRMAWSHIHVLHVLDFIRRHQTHGHFGRIQTAEKRC